MEEKIISAEEAVARYNEKINPKLEIKKLLSDGIEAIFIKEINSFIKSAIDNSRNSVDCVISLAEYNEEYKEIAKNNSNSTSFFVCLVNILFVILLLFHLFVTSLIKSNVLGILILITFSLSST